MIDRRATGRKSARRASCDHILTRRRLLATGVALAASAYGGPAATMRLAPPTELEPASGPQPLADPPQLAGDVSGALTYLITDGDRTLVDIALERDLGILGISALNPGVDVWVPGAERLVALPTAYVLPEHERRGIIVNLAELRLYHFQEPGTAPRVHTIGIGRDGFSTPLGPTTVTRKQADPIWYPTEATRADRPDLPAMVPAGPDNPLGRHALYLGFPTYLIHGTNKPYGVGRRVSRGCIRMYPDVVADLFERVPVGTPVRIMDDPIKLGWSAGELYLEVHPDRDQLDELEADYRFTKKPAPDIASRIIAKAGDASPRLAWDVIDQELINRRGVPVRITRTALAGTSNEHRHGSSIPRDFISIY